jgi:hypothetical protein
MIRNKVGNANLQQFDSNLYSQVLDKVYNSVNFQKIRYQLLNNKSYLDDIKNSKYYITPHFQGYNYLLVFMVINNVKYNLLIMKNLKFWKEQNNIQDIKIYKFDTNNSYIDYSTISIFDGKMINNSNKSSFIINDIYNKTMENLTLPEKLDQVNNILNKIKVNDNHNFDCKVCRLYNFSELPDLVFNKLKTTELKINGLMFLPEYTGKYYIYTNDTEFDELKNNSNNNVTITIKKTNTNSEIEFYMKKTNVPDVYELYDNDETNLVKEGIAHIPNMKTSHYFRNIFQNKNMIKINCIKSDKFNKWIPICDDYIDYSESIF